MVHTDTACGGGGKAKAAAGWAGADTRDTNPTCAGGWCGSSPRPLPLLPSSIPQPQPDNMRGRRYRPIASRARMKAPTKRRQPTTSTDSVVEKAPPAQSVPSHHPPLGCQYTPTSLQQRGKTSASKKKLFSAETPGGPASRPHPRSTGRGKRVGEQPLWVRLCPGGWMCGESGGLHISQKHHP
jgi:hypothetical protein